MDNSIIFPWVFHGFLPAYGFRPQKHIFRPSDAMLFAGAPPGLDEALPGDVEARRFDFLKRSLVKRPEGQGKCLGFWMCLVIF
jgi:hypothetical protein